MTILAGFALGLVLHDPLKKLIERMVVFLKYQWAILNDKKAYS